MGAESFLTLQIVDFAEGVDDRVAALLQAGTGITLTYNDGAGTLTIANTGIGGSTGSTDNRILRADGTGGSTVQNSAVTIDDSGNISGLAMITSTRAGSMAPVNPQNQIVVYGGFSGCGVGFDNNGELSTVVNSSLKSTLGANLKLSSNGAIQFNSATNLSGSYDTQIVRNATGPSAEIRAAGGLIVNNAAGSANAALACGAITASGSSTIDSIPALGALTLVPSSTYNNFFGINIAGGASGTVRGAVWLQPFSGEFRIGGVNGGGYYPTIFSNGSQALGFNTSGHAIFAGMVYVGAYTVGTLPSASGNPGRLAQVTDSSVTTNGSAVAGGGSNRVPVFSDGTNWIVK